VQAEHIDDTTLAGSLQLLALVGRGTGPRRPAHLARMAAAGPAGGRAVMRATCEVGSRMAERLRLGAEVTAALRQSTEVWDGTSGAYGHAGDEIPTPARYALLASQVVLHARLAGPDAALAVVRQRSGRWFDPDLAAVFARAGPDLLHHLDEVDVWAEVLAVEPTPVACVPEAQLDEVAEVFADMVDLKSPDTLGHSTGVAALTAEATRLLGMSAERGRTVRRAALLHDLGRVAVGGSVWQQARPLRTAQWEQVRLHPYHTERILDRSSALAPLAPLAGMHHERLDGSGYHHHLSAAALPAEARVLATADAFQAMTQPRPHRAAMPPDEAALILEADVAAGRLDAECVQAVVAAAGQPLPRRTVAWPADLTDREVEVIRVLARGASNRAIAEQLVISRRTAEHHVQHIYAKIGASTRAAAALFAMEHGLVR
jgi:HD-GYP domain-containing protein (c-di-GMP phosphodiesterase class II)